ncbi:MAG: DUF3516 domain-containing protein [Corynebacterium sp.]|nr:DUF3516 domain-containing protein [Corynebacterium sp.]
MNLAAVLPDLSEVPESVFDEVIFDSFLRWATNKGISLYPAQEEASLGMLSGDNIILSTPTGSGKSMVAIAAHFFALAREQRSFYTAPIKALVNEKFFALCEVFGAENVGMMTGDATVNGSAPIICATAEVVANIALRDGDTAALDVVIMDEFHYYSDPQRGWAWQVPLIECPQAQFLLMSATLGDTQWLQDDLSKRTGRTTSLVAGSTRPIPLDYAYTFQPLHETLNELIEAGKNPIYVVHFTQRAAAEQAQALTSLALVDAEEKQAIAEAIGDFRFSTVYGKTLSKLLRKGIGVHHAGMLPKYRRLVERLAQNGLLKVICGTDTLGVGINVPIRTVVFSSLAKFDGQRQRLVNSREFHQIAGRAGRAGFDTAGSVVVEAPEHEIENYRLRQRANQDPKKAKKRRKAAPEGQVVWSERAFERLTHAEPEDLQSQFRVSNAMVLNVLQREGDQIANFHHLLRTNHNQRARQNLDILTTISLIRGLLNAGIVTRTEDHRAELTQQFQRDFALDQPLSPFAVAALEVLDPESDTYAFDVVSVFEAILEDPKVILIAQQRAERGKEIAALKAEGVSYETRMNMVEDITWPKPLEDELEQAFDIFCQGHPWAREFDISPKAVVRDMLEKGMTFSDLIATYGVGRSEGVVLRYLSDVWRTLEHSLPEQFRTTEVEDICAWLGEVVRQVDSSLLDEWAQLADPDAPIAAEAVEQERAFGVSDPNALSAQPRALQVMVRNLMFRMVQLFADEAEDDLAALVEYLPEAPDFPAALDEYFEQYDEVDDSPAARGPEYFHVERNDDRQWKVRQTIKDPQGDNSFALRAIVDLDATDEAGEVRLASLEIETN